MPSGFFFPSTRGLSRESDNRYWHTVLKRKVKEPLISDAGYVHAHTRAHRRFSLIVPLSLFAFNIPGELSRESHRESVSHALFFFFVIGSDAYTCARARFDRYSLRGMDIPTRESIYVS